MYVVVSLIVVVLLVVTYNHAFPALTRLQVNCVPIDNANAKQDYYPERRGQRAIVAPIRVIISNGDRFLKWVRSRQAILREARPTEIIGRVTHYEKYGGEKKMVIDFYAVRPANIRVDSIDGRLVGRTGEIGEGTIQYVRYNVDHKTVHPVLTITGKNKDGEVIKDVIYYNKL